MPDEKMPLWMQEDTDGCVSDVDFAPEDLLHDNDVDDAVLVAGVDSNDEEAKEARRNEYRQLFPEAK